MSGKHRSFEPAYLALHRSGELAKRAERAREHLRDCDLCARYCHVNRLETIRGSVCRTGEVAVVNSFGPHHGEEDPLRGMRGSGTIFFSRCNLRCVFCQNWAISHEGEGGEVTATEIAGMMLSLQRQGCHNINFVSPSHVVAQILAALTIAAEDALRLPLVYNTGGYDSAEALALLDGVIDIYMPDMKYGDSTIAKRYSKIPDYVPINRSAVKEMHRQVGDLVLDEYGIAKRGLLVRHLVLPNELAGTEAVMGFLAKEVSPNTYINIMGQYYPSYHASDYMDIARRPRRKEIEGAYDIARRIGLERCSPGLFI